MPNPVDTAIESARNFTQPDLPYDIFFAVSSGKDMRHHCGQWREMNTFCKDLAKAIPNAKLLAPGIDGMPQMFGPPYQRALESCKIGLNISRRNDIYLYSSDRISHMIGNGLAVAIDRASGFEDIFTEDEVIFYSSETELFSKIEFYIKNHEAQKLLAQKGYDKYHSVYNAKNVSLKILNDLGS
jgi:hypothetical protein